MKTNKKTLVISGLVILFSVNLYGCSNEQADITTGHEWEVQSI